MFRTFNRTDRRTSAWTVTNYPTTTSEIWTERLSRTLTHMAWAAFACYLLAATVQWQATAAARDYADSGDWRGHVTEADRVRHQQWVQGTTRFMYWGLLAFGSLAIGSGIATLASFRDRMAGPLILLVIAGTLFALQGQSLAEFHSRVGLIPR